MFRKSANANSSNSFAKNSNVVRRKQLYNVKHWHRLIGAMVLGVVLTLIASVMLILIPPFQRAHAQTDEFKFDLISAFLCETISDTQEYTEYMYGLGGDGKYLVKSNRCINQAVFFVSSEIIYTLIKIIRGRNANFDICKMRMYYEEVFELYTACSIVQKNGMPYLTGAIPGGKRATAEWGARTIQ